MKANGEWLQYMTPEEAKEMAALVERASALDHQLRAVNRRLGKLQTRIKQQALYRQTYGLKSERRPPRRPAAAP